MADVIRDALDYDMMVGQSIRVKECNKCVGQGNSKAVQITRKEDGFLCHCFRCSITFFIPDTGASPADVQRLVKAREKSEKEDNRPEVVTLPDDYTTKIPPEPLVQMYDLNIEDREIEAYDIGWSPSHQRIIIPVYKYGKGPGGWAKKLVGVLGRKLDSAPESKPKWWTQRQKDVKHPRFLALPKTFNKEIVLVEDVFSAIRVSAVGVVGCALLTTYLPYEMYSMLAGWKVHIWLDENAHGKAVKYQAALGSNAVVANTILTVEDPKKYDDDQIREALANGYIKRKS